jgi:hypothetical protein
MKNKAEATLFADIFIKDHPDMIWTGEWDSEGIEV